MMHEKLLQGAPIPMCALDAYGYIQETNAAFEALCGYPVQALIGQILPARLLVGDDNVLALPTEMGVAVQKIAFRHYTGQTIEAETQTVALRLPSGELTGFIQTLYCPQVRINSPENAGVAYVDINEYEQMKKKLAYTELKLQGVLDSASEINILLDVEMRILSFNKIAADSMRSLCSKEMQIMEDFPQYLLPQNREGFIKSFNKVLEGEIIELELSVNEPYNTIWYYFKYCPVYDAQNRFIAVSFSALDITMRKMAENEARQASEMFHNFFKLSADFMCVVNVDTIFLEVNPTFTRELGYTLDELKNKSYKEFVHPDDFLNTMEQAQILGEGGIVYNFENRYRCKDGRYIWLSWKSLPMQQDTGLIYATARNITALKKSQELNNLNFMLKDRPHKKELYKAYFDNILQHLLLFLDCREGFLGEIDGEKDKYSLYVLASLPAPQTIEHTTNLPYFLFKKRINEYLGDFVKNKLPMIENNPDKDEQLSELSERHKTMQNFLLLPVMNALDEVIGVVGLANKEHGFSNNEVADLQSFLDNFSDVIQHISDERTIQIQNLELKSTQEELRQNFEELATQRDYLEDTLDELKKSQEKMLRSEKLAAVGKLVASIAHEINTPLGAIKASAKNLNCGLKEALQELPKVFQILNKEEQYLFFEFIHNALEQTKLQTTREEREMRAKLEQELGEYKLVDTKNFAYMLVSIGVYKNLGDYVPLLCHQEAKYIIQIATHLINQQRNTQTIQTALDKVAKIVYALKVYTRQGHHDEKTIAKITDTIDTILTLYYGQLKYGIEIVKVYDDVPPIACYVDELGQVWTNLVQNAAQAMNNIGLLEIKVRKLESAIEVSFRDTGKGIPQEIDTKIFEPFFTTKPIGEGSGLGLDITKRIVEKHNGKIWFKSVPNVGTTFFVRIPIS